MMNRNRGRQGGRVLIVHRNDGGDGFFKRVGGSPRRIVLGEEQLRRAFSRGATVLLPKGMQTARRTQLKPMLRKLGARRGDVTVEVVHWHRPSVRRALLENCSMVITVPETGPVTAIKLHSPRPNNESAGTRGETRYRRPAGTQSEVLVAA